MRNAESDVGHAGYRFRCLTSIAMAAVFATVAAAQGPPTDRIWAFLSENPEEAENRAPAAPIRNILLRPNSEMTFHVYVHNPTDNPQDVTVVVASGPGDSNKLADASARVPAHMTVRVAAAKSPAGTPADKLPANNPIGTALYLRVLDKAGAEIDRSPPLAIRILLPSEYVKATATFTTEPDGLKNRLTVRAYSDKKFSGPPAKVRLSLSTDRIPALIPESAEDGTFIGEVPSEGEALLVANNLRFRGTDRDGVFTVDVDGYERAFLFKTDFRGTTPDEAAVPSGLRIAAPSFAQPGNPCPVRLEVDKPPSNGTIVEFGFDQSGTGVFVTKRFPSGVRDESAALRWGGPDGGLVFTTKVSDRIVNLDTAGVFGPRRLRLRLLDKDLQEVKPPEPVNRDLVLDKDGPKIESFGVVNKEVIRGKPVTLQATAVDPESGLSAALFFLGDPPTPDGKASPGGRVIPATPPTELGGPYTATLTLPDAKRLSIGVRFTNPLGLSTDKIVELEPADPPEPKKFGAIKGIIVQGSDERPQKKLAVKLSDAKGMEVKTLDTNDKGEFAFEDLLPGKYVLFAAFPRDRTTAQKEVTVEVGKTAEIKLALKR